MNMPISGIRCLIPFIGKDSCMVMWFLWNRWNKFIFHKKRYIYIYIYIIIYDNINADFQQICVKIFRIESCDFICPYKCSGSVIQSDFTLATRYLNDKLLHVKHHYLFLPYIEGYKIISLWRLLFLKIIFVWTLKIYIWFVGLIGCFWLSMSLITVFIS
jgi:hypothetical protein